LAISEVVTVFEPALWVKLNLADLLGNALASDVVLSRLPSTRAIWVTLTRKADSTNLPLVCSREDLPSEGFGFCALDANSFPDKLVTVGPLTNDSAELFDDERLGHVLRGSSA
jgi:hypothetical protein